MSPSVGAEAFSTRVSWNARRSETSAVGAEGLVHPVALTDVEAVGWCAGWVVVTRQYVDAPLEELLPFDASTLP